MLDPNKADICPVCQQLSMPKWIKESMETGRMCQNLSCKFIQIKKKVKPNKDETDN